MWGRGLYGFQFFKRLYDKKLGGCRVWGCKVRDLGVWGLLRRFIWASGLRVQGFNSCRLSRAGQGYG